MDEKRAHEICWKMWERIFEGELQSLDDKERTALLLLKDGKITTEEFELLEKDSFCAYCVYDTLADTEKNCVACPGVKYGLWEHCADDPKSPYHKWEKSGHPIHAFDIYDFAMLKFTEVGQSEERE